MIWILVAYLAIHIPLGMLFGCLITHRKWNKYLNFMAYFIAWPIMFYLDIRPKKK